MIVAESNGYVVGARPFVPLPMRAGGEDVTAVYLGNAMVHPEHRHQGLFTQMTETAMAAYADVDGAFFFNFADEQCAPGYRQLTSGPSAPARRRGSASRTPDGW